jgi:ADP-heptose:LPS heptosyltransferase
MRLEHRRILWCLRYGIGDVVMELPLLQALRRAAPRAHLTVLGANPALELLEHDPRVDGRSSLQDMGVRHRWDQGTPEARLQVGRWLVDSDFDLVLDTRHAPPVVAAAVRTGNLPVLESDEQVERRVVASGRGAVRAIRASARAGWGIPVPRNAAAPRLRLGPAATRFASGLVDTLGGREPSLVAISPVASLGLKRWPVSRFIQLADRLIEDGHTLLVFCGPELQLGAELIEGVRCPDRCTLIGPLHLTRIGALLVRCELLVSNDTGIMHIASAVGTPTLGIFGPTAPSIYRPPGAAARSVGGEHIDCPHRNTRSLQPPGCWSTDRCLIAEEGCILDVDAATVLDTAICILSAATDRRPAAQPLRTAAANIQR